MDFYQIRDAAEPGEAELLVYGVIGDSFWDDVNSRRFVQDLAKIKASRIRVRINSVGGSLFGGLGMYNALRSHGAEIVSVVEGLAASAASIVALAGSRIVMRRGSMMMIHAPVAGVDRGNAQQLRGVADMLDKARDSIVAIYEARTGRSYDELRALVDAETWMTAAETVAAGFADSVDEEAPAAALMARESFLVIDGLGFAAEQHPTIARLAAQLAPPPVQDDAADPAADPPPEEDEAAAEPPATEDEPGASDAPPADSGAVVLDLSPAGLLARARAALGDDGPAIAAALLADGGALALAAARALVPQLVAALQAEGAAAERARLRAIDDLAFVGHDALLAGAKYGEKPLDAAGLALAVAQAERAQRQQYLADRAKDAAGVVVPPAPLPIDTAEEERQRVINRAAARAAARHGRS